MMSAEVETGQSLIDRAALWSLAAKLFAYPAEGEFDPAVRLSLSPAEASAPWPADVSTALRDLQRHVETEASAGPGLVDDLASEHTYLFARRTLAPPRETSYSDGPATAHGASMADLAAFYRAFGFAPGPSMPPDHLCVELAFVAALLAKEAIALERGWTDRARRTRAARRTFIADHLRHWLPAFATRLEEHARSRFYPLVATFTLALFHAESE